MSSQSCPTNERLGLYVRGRLIASDHEEVDLHIDSCPRCCSLVETIDNEVETFLDVLKDSADVEPPPAPELDDLVRWAKSVRQEPTEVLRDGDVLGNYQLAELLGVGGMGRVFRAYHQRMKRDVAVKVMAPELLRSPRALERFEREVEAAARLTHPSIVTAFDADEVDGRVFLVMEYVPGRNLDQVVQQGGPLSLSDATTYIRQAAEGLRFAHERGIVHRDIKPANLMLVENGDAAAQAVKILDMGLARIRLEEGAASESLTTTNGMMGTAAFMAPEQALNPRLADERADIYSLGCTLFFLATAKHVYQGQSVMEVALAHREKPVPSLAEVVENCPRELDDLVGRMLAKDPADRPTAGEVVDQLNTMNWSESAQPRRVASVPVWFVGIAAVIALVGVSFGLFVMFGSGPDTPSGHNSAASKRTTPGTPKISMVEIPAGVFEMGSPDHDVNARPDQKPRHRVRISRPFLMSKHEITREQFARVMGSGEQLDKQAGGDSLEDRRPISGVSWMTAIQFCNRLSERHGLPPYYKVEKGVVRQVGGSGFHLPTEAQWEYACRAGSKARWHFGEDELRLSEFEWHVGNSDGKPQPVGMLKPNQWGLHDMHGNVPEWCWDRYSPDYYRNSPEVDPPGASSGKHRVFRGGSAGNRVTQISASQRRPLGSTYGVSVSEVDLLLQGDHGIPGSQGVGIRVVRSIPN